MKSLFQVNAIMLLICIALLSPGQQAFSQKSDSTDVIAGKIAHKDFVFVANSVSPLRGQMRILTSAYDVRLNKDSLISFLPYFGHAQTVPITSDEAAVMFTSTNFEYSYEAAKKRSWELQIKFKDQTNTKQFNFIIYEDGNALLNVTSNFRDPISYRGYIKM